ncbi:unnamed protein product [Mytilus coruscus]|uniref:Uncharacterized protein n=1 Tax=Mytilus coruscus TaxID=42192 RepID=A0A6J8D7P9_MYTCO|nr:unnamed protein product [Mytilus coruscus]
MFHRKHHRFAFADVEGDNAWMVIFSKVQSNVYQFSPAADLPIFSKMLKLVNVKKKSPGTRKVPQKV